MREYIAQEGKTLSLLRISLPPSNALGFSVISTQVFAGEYSQKGIYCKAMRVASPKKEAKLAATDPCHLPVLCG